MFDYIKGTLISLKPQAAVVDVGGLGYLLHTPLSTFSAMPPIGQEITFYIFTIIREDSHKNFGFLTAAERDLFEKISGVSGIGPKTALALIGHLDRRALESAITSANTVLLSKIPGIGKKTAERLIVELRDKVLNGLTQMELKPLKQQELSASDQMIHDAHSALINLGYHTIKAQQAIQKALSHESPPDNLSTLIHRALSGI